MEWILVAFVLGILVSFGFYRVLGVLFFLFGVTLYLSLRTYRQRCQSCGRRPITVKGLRFCNQCGVAQKSGMWRIRCHACQQIARTELNLKYCNCCGKLQIRME